MTNNSPPPNSDSRFVEKCTNTLIRWFPMGGSTFVLVHSIWMQNVGQALIMFPVTTVTVIWAAYTKSFLVRCQEIAEERGKADPDRLICFLKTIGNAISWELSNFQGRYLRAQASACEEYSVEGYSSVENQRLLLEEVYVPLEVSGELQKDLHFSRFNRNHFALDTAELEQGASSGSGRR